MHTFLETASYVKSIDRETWLILKNILLYSRKFERIPLDLLYRKTKFSKKFFDKKILWLHRNGFVEYFKQPYESIRLLTRGLDLIALKKLSDRGLIAGVGRQIGTGKESDIYEVISPENKILSLKVFRLGRVSFTKIRIKRDYGPKDLKLPWYVRNIYAAKKEYNNLKYVFRKGVSVPRPVYRVLHMILMERLDGLLLNDIKKLDNPLQMFNKIIYEVKKAYDANIVNGDLSQFNVFISKTGKVFLIDWPQAVSADTDEGINLLKRDIINLSKFFFKKHGTPIRRLCDILSIYTFSEMISCDILEKEILAL